jgi:hypothetical protein
MITDMSVYQRSLKKKEYIEARIRDFDIDFVLDEETQVNIMT